MRRRARVAQQDVSVLLLGNRHKLAVVTALARSRDGRVNLGELAVVHGVAASVYYAPVKDLMTLGLVRQAEIAAGQRRRWYERCGDTRVWKGLHGLVRALEDFTPPTATSHDPG
ncbi:hypothetical protein [Streptosporangium sp. NPDC000396]|uniref:hypothetical protein n=1 Tax=Streptosporangium sp. NPDC000396 TaxID=3366185 RepID=UPI0036B4B1A0